MLHPVDATEITVSMNGPETYALMQAILARIEKLSKDIPEDLFQLGLLMAILTRMEPLLIQKNAQHRDELNEKGE